MTLTGIFSANKESIVVGSIDLANLANRYIYID